MVVNNNLPKRAPLEEEEEEILEEEDEEELEDDEDEEEQEIEEKPILASKPVGRPANRTEMPVREAPKAMKSAQKSAPKKTAEPTKVARRYMVAYYPENVAVLDTQTNEPIFNNIPREFIAIANMFAEIKSDLEDIKDQIGRV